MEIEQEYQVNFTYTREEVAKIMEAARRSRSYSADVNSLRVYDTRVYDTEHQIIGTFYFENWYEDELIELHQDCIVGIVVQPRFSLADMLKELAFLELKELGNIKHGSYGNPLAKMTEGSPVAMPVSRQQHEQAMEQSAEEWHESGLWVRDEDGEEDLTLEPRDVQ